jgi:AraC family transcriptional regulator
MVLIPAGLDSSWDDPDSSFMRLRLDPSLLEQVSEGLECDAGKLHLTPRFKWRDDRIEAIVWAIKAELESELPSDRLYVESLSTALAVRLIAGQSGLANTSRGLSSSKRRQLIEFIECNLGQSLSLSDLADVAGFSVSHFKTLFYRTFGMPVHQYLMRRRVERAKQLLISGLPLSQVALATGFAHQSHLARCTRKMLGMTPGALARLQE